MELNWNETHQIQRWCDWSGLDWRSRRRWRRWRRHRSYANEHRRDRHRRCIASVKFTRKRFQSTWWNAVPAHFPPHINFNRISFPGHPNPSKWILMRLEIRLLLRFQRVWNVEMSQYVNWLLKTIFQRVSPFLDFVFWILNESLILRRRAIGKCLAPYLATDAATAATDIFPPASSIPIPIKAYPFSLFFFLCLLISCFPLVKSPDPSTRPPDPSTRPPDPSAGAVGSGDRLPHRSTVDGRRSAVGGPEARRPGGRVNRPVYRWSGRRVAGRWPVWRRRQRGSGPAAAATATGRVMALMNILNPIRWYLFITIFFLTSGIYNWITERRWAMNNLNFRPVSIC